MMEQGISNMPLTQNTLWITLGGMIGLLGIGLLLLQFIKAWRDVKKPAAQAGKTVEEKLDRDNRRLNDLEEKMKGIDQAQTMTLQVLLVMLQHDITGDHVNDMNETYTKLTDFLIKRRN